MWPQRSRKILLSYRRADTAPTAGRLADRLKQKFGEENVFIDVDNIPFGTDFRTHIHKTIEECDVVIIMIGSSWSGESSGRRRLDEREDHLRIEVETALQVGAKIIPVLVDRTPMPTVEDLPRSIETLAFLNAAPLDTGRDFNVHATRIADAISATENRDLVNKIIFNSYYEFNPVYISAVAGIASGIICSFRFTYPIPYSISSIIPDYIRDLIINFVFVIVAKEDDLLWHQPYVFSIFISITLLLSIKVHLKNLSIIALFIVLGWSIAIKTAIITDRLMQQNLQVNYVYHTDLCPDKSEGSFSSNNEATSRNYTQSEPENPLCETLRTSRNDIFQKNTYIAWISSTLSSQLAGCVGALCTAIGLLIAIPRLRSKRFLVRILIFGTLTGSLLNEYIFIFFKLPSTMPLFVAWQTSTILIVSLQLRMPRTLKNPS